MKIYLLSQGTNLGYETYDAAVVVAHGENEAVLIHPDGSSRYNEHQQVWYNSMGDVIDDMTDRWTLPENIKVIQIGTTDKYTKPQVILASFNAG